MSPVAFPEKTKPNHNLPFSSRICNRVLVFVTGAPSWSEEALKFSEMIAGQPSRSLSLKSSKLFTEFVYSWLDTCTSLLNQQKHHKNPHPGCVSAISPGRWVFGGCLLWSNCRFWNHTTACQTQASRQRTLAVVWVGLAINQVCTIKKKACRGPSIPATDSLCTQVTLSLEWTAAKSRQQFALPLESPWPSTSQERKPSSHSFSSTVCVAKLMTAGQKLDWVFQRESQQAAAFKSYPKRHTFLTYCSAFHAVGKRRNKTPGDWKAWAFPYFTDLSLQINWL